MGNSIGKIFNVASFGESHGKCVGALIDGCPAGLPLSIEDIQMEVDRRHPYTAAGGTGRKEGDRVEILSGLQNGCTTGAPICMLVWNRDVDSVAYENLRYMPRPGHADYTARVKYGGFNDYRGGGRFSGRITAGFVMAGAVARRLLGGIGVEIIAHTIQIGDIIASSPSTPKILQRRWDSPVRCVDPEAAAKMLEEISRVRSEGDSLGGIVEALALNVPAGLGEPVFDTLEGDLAKAFFAIPAVKGVEFGSGFSVASLRGSQNNDAYVVEDGKIMTATNHAGGINGGISNGMPITARIAFKPVPSISRVQKTVDLREMSEVELAIKGRHDVCIVPRAVPVVEAMMAIILCDFSMRAGLIQEVVKWT